MKTEQWTITTEEVYSLPFKRRVRNWFATSFLGLKIVVLVLVPWAVASCVPVGLTYLENLATNWSTATIKDPHNDSVIDRYLPHVIYAGLAAIGIFLLLALLRAIPRLIMVWVLLRTVTYEEKENVAGRRFDQLLAVPKGYGLLVVSGFVGALLGLSVTDTPEARGLLRSCLLALAAIFLALMTLVAFIMAHKINDDLDAMGQGARMSAAKDFLRRWAEFLPSTTRRGRILPPRKDLVLDFARNPSVTVEVIITTAAIAFLVCYLVLIAV